ncbi:MAG: hypothetical protein COX77_02255 [Candidatus Komeilibacteria bacterium CG_4_10_14_0_2_um_filter_37_10]|uniref:Uncharacterized protein n=1 Tax=Candidatus Komeilibacteria bacterium CG_4_10_14_0_2_um_filter_37_10 TaxID=1974470 RepID=A0A2M7VF78_9BACT|nr:MAG: hypothetical protein COX77_02255 [Candidatus Komeilibacteria bacterium CG_4_10_14_0_2_um_filter_37_10]
MLLCSVAIYAQNLRGFQFTDPAKSSLLAVFPNNSQYPYPRTFIAWGTITDSLNQQYYWISFINSDYLYQFYVSTPLSKTEIKKIAHLQDSYGRNWDQDVSPSYHRTLIQTSNDWIDEKAFPRFYSWRYGREKNKIGIYDLTKVTQYYCHKLATVLGRVEIKQVVRKYEQIGYPLN